VEGAGLGMSITNKLVLIMNGNIDVKSKLGVGTEFIVRLPQKRVDSKEIRKEMAEKLQQFSLLSGSQPENERIVYEPMPYGRVLIVDDMEINLYVAKGLLTPYGLKIETAASGYEAVKKIKENEVFDLIFMDHMMPGMDGMEAVRIIREHGYTRPIVALTANALVGQAEIFLANGFDGFLSKPVDIRQLATVLHDLIYLKQSNETIEAAHVQREGREISREGRMAVVKLKPEIAEIFTKDAARVVEVMEIIYSYKFRRDDDIRLFTVNAHAMKSVLLHVHEAKLSGEAKILEQAGRRLDIDMLIEKTPSFLSELKSVIEKYKHAPIEADHDEDPEFLHEKLSAIRAACAEYNGSLIRSNLSELREKKWNQNTGMLLSKISEHLLQSEYEDIGTAVEKALEEL
jgi:CheY-like chemotaxis protein